jgi:HAD superfamily hydrolase (TIGR01509 family)
MKKRVYVFDIDDTLIIHTPQHNDYYNGGTDETLQKLLNSLNADGIYIYTNGTYGHGEAVVKNLKLENSINGIFARDTIPFMKPYNESFDYVRSQIVSDMNTYDIEFLFFDDLLDNLKTAKGIGWNTVWINPKSSNKEKYVDYSFSNIYQALTFCYLNQN